MTRGNFQIYHSPYKRGTPLNDAEKIMISIDTKLAMQKPEIVKKMFQKGMKWTPAQIEQMSKKRTAYFANPDNRKKTSDATRKGMDKPEIKAKMTGENNSQYGVKQSKELILRRLPWLDPTNGLPHFRLGKKHTAETLEKMMKARENFIMPTEDTIPEKTLQNALEKAGIKFEKHRLFRLTGTRHRVDIFIEPNICIEVDGEIWHTLPHQMIRDLYLNCELTMKMNCIVIRFWAKDVLEKTDECIETITSISQTSEKKGRLYLVNLGEK